MPNKRKSIATKVTVTPPMVTAAMGMMYQILGDRIATGGDPDGNVALDEKAVEAMLKAALDAHAPAPGADMHARHMATLLAGNAIVSPEEIIAKMTPAGAWTRATLAEWGVPWPPPRGWRQALEQRWAIAQEASHELRN